MPGLPANADASAVTERVTASIVFLGLAAPLGFTVAGRGGYSARRAYSSGRRSA